MEALGYTETFDSPTPPNSVERYVVPSFLLLLRLLFPQSLSAHPQCPEAFC